ncbi:MAG: TonB-dependent receptor [Phenylobacterium sp.]|uniref:TonB-dependent receptor plug domain-containing protein n=1 Tax=Phenylobacterium sp. TaxID=1871053 RepID=UPI001A5F9F0C|nr:TonB-dependent receptor [Phenylobacterium sp.]MBL8774028.1 TonB-dependent receptor [Phenylobacterium sp.]
MAALLIGAQAAQAADAAEDAVATAESEVEEITVTGSRIVRDGYNAPTPVSVVGTAEIKAQAPANLADFVNTIPAIVGSTTPASSSPSLSAGSAGINALNLRALGITRTLVLIDGQRSVASTTTGAVDINTIPQGLVERVEVVTGGASAAYGSDAVGGVVNFILNKKYEGLKAKIEYGETTYGDGANYKATVTFGDAFMGGKLRVLANAEYARTEEIPDVPRDWNMKGYFNIQNPLYAPGNGQPEKFVGYGIGPAQVTPGGLVTSGPLRGTYFGRIDPATGRATVGQLAYGLALGQWMIGGDWQYTGSNYFGSESLLPGEIRTGLFGRTSYEVSDSIELFAEASWNRYSGSNHYIQPTNIANVTIRSDNAYLPTSVRNQMTALGLTTLQIGTTNFGIPVGGARNRREVYRYVAGAKGKFELMEKPWNWDFYVQRGQARTREQLFGSWNNANLALAQDAVFAPAGNAAGIPAGTIVCRSTLTAPTNGCVPINRLGIGGVTQAALNYIIPADPYRKQKLTQTVAALTFSGPVFDLPAGAVQAAFGGEWRREQVSGFVEPRFNSGWLYGNYLPNFGNYEVEEGFVELDVPVIEGLNLNAAGRYTHYSTSGDVQTWKIGGTWAPIEDIKFRGNISRDIRAPNLDELFAAGTARSNSVLINNRSFAYVQNATGNPNLDPEVADSFTVGFVASPRVIPGFTVAFDYYEIKIKDAIGQLQPQDVADLCFLQNVQAQCANIIGTYVNGVLQSISTIKLQPFNFAKQKERGFDIEGAYRLRLDDVMADLPGDLTFRGMITHYIENVTDRGIGFPTDAAGATVQPSWIYRLSATYSNKPWTYNLVARGVSSGKLDNSYIECQTNCPATTVQHPTINDNSIPAAVFFDFTVGWEFEVGGKKGDLQLSIRNVFDKDPPLVANLTSSNSTAAFPQTVRIYDQLGRIIKASLEVQF